MNERMHCSRPICLAAAALALLAGLKNTQAADQEVVKFRLTKWKSAHMADEQAAESFSATLEQIGCEVKLHAHGDHHDVTYRCSDWRSISLKSHAEAHKWERWLKAKGFQTEHHH